MIVLLNGFHLNGHTLGFHPQTQKLEPLFVQHNKQRHRKVLLNSFCLNGHTLGFHSQTQKLEPPSLHSTLKSIARKYCSIAIIRMHGRTLGFHPYTLTSLNSLSAPEHV